MPGMILENIEGLPDWNIRADWAEGREPGISAFVRLKDEADWCIAALESIAGWCDEIMVALQGEQSDATLALVMDWVDARDDPNVRACIYPFDSFPNGPGHDAQPRGSVRERAYFYNWCLSKTTKSHALKWDGDMVALDGAGERLRQTMHYSSVGFAGIDLTRVGESFHYANHDLNASDPRLFRVAPETFYETGPRCERPVFQAARKLEEPLYLHFKWCKPFASISKAWPEDWHRQPHFRRLLERAEPGEPYEGPWPSCLIRTTP